MGRVLRPIGSSRASAVRLAMAATTIVALAAVALARGGGGGNFDPGGGGGGSGDGFLIWLIFRLIVLSFRHPVIGIPLLIVTIVVFWRVQKAGRRAYTQRVLRRGRGALDAEFATAQRAKIAASDPTFEAEAFAARVRHAFRRVQEAWCAQDLAPLRPFVSDGVYERFAMQIDEQRALGYRDRMDGLTVDAVTLVHCESGERLDTATLRIAATAADYRVSLATGGRVSGSTSPERFAEYWTFVRRRGAKPRGLAGGLLEGRCPNCGDSVEGNQFADCRSCKARLRSGEFDWVLVEITQASEWAVPTAAVARGAAELAAADASFCAEEMEDRASVAFWRWATAMRTGDARPLAGVATDEVVRAVTTSLDPSASGRRYIGECGVGSVELFGVLDDPDATRAIVGVRWSGTEFEAAAGRAPRRLDPTGVRTTILVFERAPGVTGRVADAFSSAHCAGCGAPAEGTSAVCAYCSSPLATPSRGWTLARIATQFEAAARVLLERLRGGRPVPAAGVAEPARAALPAVSPAGLVAWAARAAASDGEVDGRERAGLVRLAERAQVPASEVDAIVRRALAADGEPDLPHSAHESREWLHEAIRVALSDGVVTKEETSVLQRLGSRAGMTAADVRIEVNRVKAAMYQDAKAALRRASSS
jgi:tellurite resistance protein